MAEKNTIIELKSRNITEVEMIHLKHQEIMVVTGSCNVLRFAFAISPFTTSVQKDKYPRGRYNNLVGKVVPSKLDNWTGQISIL